MTTRPVDDVATLEKLVAKSEDASRLHEALLARVAARRGREQIRRERPESEFPELVVQVPDRWESIILAPLYDLHIGHRAHDAALLARHLEWIRRTPNVLTWLGGDIIENASKLSVGAGVYEQDIAPDAQLVRSMLTLARIAHKTLFSLPGNHEARSDVSGFSVGAWLAVMLAVPHFPDYAFCAVHWRGQRFRVLAHHGSGAAQTAGGQRMAARKDVAWARPFDVMWTGHLHSPLVDMLYQTDVDQRTGRYYERNGVIVISPSYLRYFGTYAAARRYPPGMRGLGSIVLRPDGRIDVSMHARGRRL